jgi:hypothetical protein
MSKSGVRSSSVALVIVQLVAVLASAFALAQVISPSAANPAAAIGTATEFLRGATPAQLVWLAVPVATPLVALLVLLLLRPRSDDEPAGAIPEVESRPEVIAPPSPAVGLRLLATLQEEARLIDFLRENIDSYSDDQVGAAVRAIHAALRKAIDERLTLEPILPGEDGDPVEVPDGFQPALIRLTGNPTGRPPYKGILRHGGWRARDVRLPVPTAGSDPSIIEPAEVEIG